MLAGGWGAGGAVGFGFGLASAVTAAAARPGHLPAVLVLLGVMGVFAVVFAVPIFAVSIGARWLTLARFRRELSRLRHLPDD